MKLFKVGDTVISKRTCGCGCGLIKGNKYKIKNVCYNEDHVSLDLEGLRLSYITGFDGKEVGAYYSFGFNVVKENNQLELDF